MSTQYDADPFADALLFADDADAPLDEWTLDDLDRSADLVSLRSVWAHADDPTD